MITTKSQRTIDLEKALATSVAEDEADKWKAPSALTPSGFVEKWLAEVRVKDGTQHVAAARGFKHDVIEMCLRIIELTQLGHFKEITSGGPPGAKPEDRDSWREHLL